MKDNLDFYKKILEKTVAKGGKSAELFYESREDLRCILTADSGLVPSYGHSEGAALRIMHDEKILSVHLEHPEEEDFLCAARMLGEKRCMAHGDPSIDHAVRQRNKRKRKESKTKRSVSASGSLLDSAAAVRDLMQNVRSSLNQFFRERFSYSILASCYRQKVEIASMQEEFAEDTRNAALFKIAVSVGEGENGISSELNISFPSVEKMIEEIDPEEAGKKMVQSCLRQKRVVPAPMGEMPIILAPGTGGVFFHEAVGHIVEADSPFLLKFHNELQSFDFGRELSIYDDPSCMERGRYAFDDEGIPARKKAVIENGKLTNLVHCVSTAKKAELKPLGNGRRQSFRNNPLPRTSALYVAPGASDPESILRSTMRGIYVSKFGNAFLDESAGDFYIHVAEGRIIEDGKLGSHIEEAVLKGKIFKIFKAIDRIGSDLSFERSGLVCSKGGQALPATVGAPTMRLASILVFRA